MGEAGMDETGVEDTGMEDVARWIWCGFAGVMAVLGLFVAAGASNPVGYWGGLGFFVFAVLFVMHQVKLAFDHAEAGGHGTGH